MKRIFTLLLPVLLIQPVNAQSKISWVYTSPYELWKSETSPAILPSADSADVEINPSDTMQTIEGFGTCFNELGWVSLSQLATKDRDAVMKELFAPGVGANFTICRMPVGANDFSRNWYSYDETAGDFDLKNFSISHDLESLVPFIQSAKYFNPYLRIWASPWSPPSWMKYNGHYAAKSILGDKDIQSEEWGVDTRGLNNGLSPDKEGKEGTDMFIQEEKYFKAYALYFARFIQAYRQKNINIEMVMPQNEFNSAQVFPSCTWTAKGLSGFIRYLGPQMENMKVKLFFGTMERENPLLVDTILTSAQSGKYILGAGFQWAGKDAIGAIHKKYPSLTLYQTEQECGNGKNDWKYCTHTWDLIKHYFNNGVNAYMYWNTSLKKGGISSWGWKQNSLISVDTVAKTYHFNYEYYLMKHLSHFVMPGAKKLNTSGGFNNLLAFINPDGSMVIVAENNSKEEKKIVIKTGGKIFSPAMKPNTFNTFLIE